jgi:pimeloyl-ACP methyl ester carboxylesterase
MPTPNADHHILLDVSVPRTAQLPVGVEPLWLATQRGDFATLCSGTSGPVVLLVPGFTGSKEDFTPLLPPLAAAGFRAVAYDQAGQYQSARDGQPVGGHQYSIRGWSQDLAQIAQLVAVQHGDAPVHLVGHSFGGLVARDAVLAEPARFASLTLLDSGPAALPEEHRPQLRLLREIAPSHTMGQIWDLKEMLEQADGVPRPEPEVAAFLKQRWLTGSVTALADMASVLLTCPDRTDELAAVRIPCLVAFGAGDTTAWPLSDQREMAARLSCEAVEIPDAEHSPPTENPEATAAVLLQFLRAIPQR